MTWCAGTYGALAVLQVAGGQQGYAYLMEWTGYTWKIGIIPMIPLSLLVVTLKMEQSQTYLLQLWRQYSRRLWILRKLFGNKLTDDKYTSLREPVNVPNDFFGLVCLMTEALILPTVSVICGRLLFPRIQPYHRRTLYGCLTFLSVKNIVGLYY